MGHGGRQRGVACEKAAAHAAQGNHASARERGNVNDGLRFEALGVGQGITQYQPAFGIGVEDLDGLAAHAGHHVARFDGAAAGQVFTSRNQADHIDVGLQFGQCLEHAQHAGGATHVVLHFIHFGGGLDGNATAVEGDAFAHQHHRGLVLGGTLVMQFDEFQGLSRAPCHRQKSAHAQFFHVFVVHHVAFDAWQFRQGLGSARKMAGRGVVGRPIGPFLGQLDAAHGGHTLGKRGGQFGAVGNTHLDQRQRARLGRAQGRGVDVTGFGHSAQGHMERLAVRRLVKTQGELFGFGRLDQGNGRSHPFADVARLAICQLHQDQPRASQAGWAVDVEQAAGLVGQVTGLHGFADQDRQGAPAGLDAAREQHQQNITFFMASLRRIQI